MTDSRSVEDRLRAEYFELQPEIRRTVLETETRIRHLLLPMMLALKRYERILVTSRVQDCESAVDALRRRQELGRFDSDEPQAYTLTTLRDLAGVRVMVFPRKKIDDVHAVLRDILNEWTVDHIPEVAGEAEPLAVKYFGNWAGAGRVVAEIQIVSLLIGLFWEVEHSAIYKPDPKLQGVARSLVMMDRRDDVVTTLHAFQIVSAEFSA